MAGDLLLPMRVPSSMGDKNSTLATRVYQIHSQKGAFRHVTESSLIKEIEAQKHNDEDTTMLDIEDREHDSASQSKISQLIMKSRDDMMQQLRCVPE